MSTHKFSSWLQGISRPARNPAAFSALESPGPSLDRGRLRIGVVDAAQHVSLQVAAILPKARTEGL
jgi:hypothetical protein